MKPIDCSNLAVFGSTGTIILLAGVAVLMKWISSQIATRAHAESLTPADLRVLEASAEKLIDDIKETASIACRDLDDRCEDLRKLILIADQKIALWAQLTSESQDVRHTEHPEPTEAGEDADVEVQSRVYHLADSGSSAADIARETGLPIGEVTLMLSLRSAARV